MAKTWIVGLVLAGVYVVLAALPLALALSGATPQGRGFWVEFGVALGFVALAMMGMQFLLIGRIPAVSSRLGQDSLLQFHRQVGLIAAGLVFAHPVTMIAAAPEFWSFFDPRVNLLRAMALTAALVAVTALIVMALRGERLGVSYEWWRLTHGLLGSLVMLIGLAHVLMVGRYIWSIPKQGAVVLLVGVPLAMLAHVRLVRPLQAAKRPYTVAEVRRERERVWTVALEAKGRHGRGPLRFEPGQFVWLTFGRTPMSLHQHPFTIASSAERPERLEFTIKELGDFTRTLGEITPGTTAFVEGPAGNFGLGRRAAGAVMIVGGIGVTPAMSILRTMRDRRDPRPVTLIYGNKTLEKAVFRGELDALSREMNLRIVHVPQEGPEGWEGPSGYVDRGVLERYVTEADLREREFLICGPDVMMDGIESALLEMGAGRDRIKSERFNVL